MAHDKLTRLTEKKLALEQVIHELRLRQRADVKRLRARQEALWGRLVVRWMKQDGGLHEQLHVRLESELLRPGQRRLLVRAATGDAAEAGEASLKFGQLE